MNTKRACAFAAMSRLKEILDSNSCHGAFVILAALACTFALAAFSMTGPADNPAPGRSHPQEQPAAKSHDGADLSAKSPDELAAYVFEHHGCTSCHTLGRAGKLGFTDRGKEVGKNFEGCISLLTSMNVIAQVKPANRTAQDKEKAARFKEFGCTECHQITPGKLGLTESGKKLKSLHMACTDVERILSK
jgi:cytochrome c551/c552